jgi:DNA-binding response OmpR family regulator
MATSAPSHPKRVLIVEDNADAIGMLQRLLHLEGFETEAASTAAMAVKLLSWRPDFLLLDLMLPDGNGIVVLQHLRQLNLPTQVAITTGMQDGSFDVVLPLSPDRVFQKPLNLDELLMWLRPAGLA